MKTLFLILFLSASAFAQEPIRCPCIIDNFGNKATIFREATRFYVMLISPKGKIKKQYITRELAESRGAK